MNAPVVAATLRVVLAYVFFAGLWIVLSDTALEALVPDAATFARVSIYKGWAFVLVTALLLAYLLSGELRKRHRAHAELEGHVAARTAELAEAKQFLDAIIDHLPNPVFYKDAELRFVGCNRSYEKTFGLRREAIIGKTVLDIDYLPLADRRRYQEEQARLVAEGTTLQREAPIPFADGRIHQTLFSASGFHRPDGSPGGVVGLIVDITAQKETEAALAEAKLAAEEADRVKSAFLATMSHELRTPLNSIIGFTGIVLQELAGPLNAEQGKQLSMVRDSARHLLALINDVLDISKIEAGELRIVAEPYDLAESIRRVAGIVRPLAAARGLALDMAVAPDIGEAVGDAHRVEQILLNLLGNAIKFTEAGSVTLTAERIEDYIAQEGAEPVSAVRLRIVDTGIGIRPEDMAQLFQPFRQVDSKISRKHEGTGLGLAICRRLAGLMGGHIEAESRFGEGSVFMATLPLRTPIKGEFA